MKMILKDSNVLKKKPKLRLMPNHYHFVSEFGRRISGYGTLIKDGYGWYKPKKR